MLCMMEKICIIFFRFLQLLISLQNAKNRIRIICNYSSNMADRGLKIWQKLFQIKCFHMMSKFDLIWGQILHAYPTRPFLNFCLLMKETLLLWEKKSSFSCEDAQSGTFRKFI